MIEPYIVRFRKEARNNPTGLSVYYKDEYYSSEIANERILIFSALFAKEGITENTRVAIVSSNRPYFLWAVYGLLQLGAVPVLVEATQDQKDLFALTQEEPFVITDRREPYPHSRVFYFDDFLQAAKDTEPLADGLFTPAHVDPERTVLILHSSGTTGSSKKVAYSEKNVAWAIKQYEKLYHFDTNTTIAYMLPVNCTLGIVACGLTPMLLQKKIVFEDPKKLEDILEAIQKHKINILPAVPLMYKYLVQLDLEAYDLSSLKLCDSGGEVLPIAIINRFKEGAGVTITEGYGQTETTSLTHFLMPDAAGTLRLGSVGKPCAEVACRIVDASGNQVATNEIGELQVKGPMVMKGYDNAQLNTTAFTSDGWFKTGDMVYVDDEGFYYIACRIKDLNSGTTALAKPLREVEEIMYEIAGIAESASLVSSSNGLLLYIKPTDDSREARKELTSEIEKRIEGVPGITLERISYAASIPRTATGKIKKSRLEDV